MQARTRIGGFTLIELSIVLVVIGLIVGGVLVGQSLIAAAEVRAQITQIEKYNSAVNTFRGKFNAIPGDMRPEVATQFGFYVGPGFDGVLPGHRNGDGLVDGSATNIAAQGQCEAEQFWNDVSSNVAGNLIDNTFPNGPAPSIQCTGLTPALAQTMLNTYFPAAKIGHADIIYVYELSGINWYSISAATSLSAAAGLSSGVNIPVAQAYNIDRKTDDGLPATGNVQVNYVNGWNILSSPNTTTSGGTSSSCYDTTTGTYSVTVNNGNGSNCALSFKFQ